MVGFKKREREFDRQFRRTRRFMMLWSVVLLGLFVYGAVRVWPILERMLWAVVRMLEGYAP